MTPTTTPKPSIRTTETTFQCKSSLVAAFFDLFTSKFPQARLTDWDIKVLEYLDLLPRALRSLSIGTTPGTGLLANSRVTFVTWHAGNGSERGTARFFNLSPPFQTTLDTMLDRREPAIESRPEADGVCLGQLPIPTGRDSTNAPSSEAT